jgi:membrane protein implicated in regulation of membrane protease activity
MDISAATVWWVLAGIAVAVELTTGTFYLLMVALGLAAGALASYLGFGVPLQIVAAAALDGALALAPRPRPVGVAGRQQPRRQPRHRGTRQRPRLVGRAHHSGRLPRLGLGGAARARRTGRRGTARRERRRRQLARARAGAAAVTDRINGHAA